MDLHGSCPRLYEVLKKNPVIIVDAGCAGGIDSFLKDLSDREFSRTYGFEASDKEFQNVVKKNTRKNVHYFNLALFDKDGMIEFYDSATVGSVFARSDREQLYGEVFEKRTVECKKITTLVAESMLPKAPDFIKLDVEGSEMAVLRSLGESLATEVLGVKIEFGFHSSLNTNNFAEIHLMLIEAGFRLMDMTYSNNPMQGLMSGDALYIKQPFVIASSTHIKNKKEKLIKLAVMAHDLFLNELCGVILNVSGDALNAEEKAEIEKILYARIFIPLLFPFSLPRVSIVFFMLSQIFSGNISGKKSIPKLNRIGRIKYLFSGLSFFRPAQKKLVDNMVGRYAVMVQNKTSGK